MTAPKPNGLSSRAMLVDLSVRRWKGAMRDKEVSQEIADAKGSDVEMGHFYHRLVSKEALDRLTKIETAANYSHREMTLPWLDTGARVLSSAGYLRYTQVMRQYSDDWDAAEADFIGNYSNHIAEAQRRLGKLFNHVDYPDVTTLKGRFEFGYRVLPLPSAEDFRVDLGDEVVEAVKAQLRNDEALGLDRANKDVVARILETVGHMSKRLHEYKVEVDPATGKERRPPMFKSLVGNVQELADLLPALNITDDPEIAAVAQRMRDELAQYDVDVLKDSEAARDEVAKAADDILAKMADFV